MSDFFRMMISRTMHHHGMTSFHIVSSLSTPRGRQQPTTHPPPPRPPYPRPRPRKPPRPRPPSARSPRPLSSEANCLSTKGHGRGHKRVIALRSLERASGSPARVINKAYHQPHLVVKMTRNDDCATMFLSLAAQVPRKVDTCAR